MRNLTDVLETINHFVWGVPALIMILGVGIYLSIKTRFVQIRMLPQAFREFLAKFRGRKDNQDGVSPYQTLCTALAATVGTGNMAGVAGAIAMGGPGSVFWMWICALIGMGIKFAEASLAVVYRRKNGNGEWIGGPMYMIRDGMGERWKWLAGLYCFFGVIAAFGMGNATQINTVISGVNGALASVGIKETVQGNLFMGVLLGGIVLAMFLGGAKRIGKAAECLVPIASVFYLAIGMGVLFWNYDKIPGAFRLIITGALNPKAVTGGMIASVFTAMRVGTSRGVFTNEAGMGTASISYASAPKAEPVGQGLMGIVEVFIDTIVICTMTALVILCSGIQIPYGTDEGIRLTNHAFSAIYGDWIQIPIALCLCAFAFATVLGWGLYGIRCAQYLFGDNAWNKIVFLQAATVIAASVLKTGTVWMFSEIVNGLMAIPNLIALAALSPQLPKIIAAHGKHIYSLKQ